MTEENSLYEFTNDEEYENALGEIDDSDDLDYEYQNDYDDDWEDGDEEEPPYDDGEPWDEEKYEDYLEQNLKAGERYDIEHPD